MGFQLENRNWQVVPSQEVTEEVQVARFRTVVPEKGLAISKTFSLKKQSYAIGLEIELENLADRATEVVYRMGGPRGFVLEGAWYATKKRDVAIADGMGKDLTRHSFSATQLDKGSDRIRELAENGQEIRRSNVSLPQEWFDRFDADHNAVLTGTEIDAAADYLAGEGIQVCWRHDSAVPLEST